MAEAFPYPALQPMSSHCMADDASGNCESKSWMIHTVGEHDKGNDPPVQPDALGENLNEIPPMPQSALPPQPQISGAVVRQRVGCVPSHVGR